MNWDVEVARVYTLHTDTSGDLGQISDHPCGDLCRNEDFYSHWVVFDVVSYPLTICCEFVSNEFPFSLAVRL